jgi:hypothetical protein
MKLCAVLLLAGALLSAAQLRTNYEVIFGDLVNSSVRSPDTLLEAHTFQDRDPSEPAMSYACHPYAAGAEIGNKFEIILNI